MPAIIDGSNGVTTPNVITSPSGSALTLQSNGGTTAVTVTTSQNVGMGTDTPAAATGFSTGRKVLQVTPSGGGSAQLRLGAASGSMLDHDDSGSTITTLRSLYGSTDANAQMQLQSGFITLGTGTSFTERMRIASTGRGYFFNAGSATTIGDCIFNFAGTFNANRGVSFNATDSSTDATVQYFALQGTNKGSISCSSGGTAYNTTSDYRLKENVAPMQNALATVSLLKPVTYTWKQDGSNGQGFIAHELQEVVPQAVTGQKDAVDKDGNPDYQGIDTSFLVATLTAAIQELKAELDATKAEVAALKGNA